MKVSLNTIKQYIGSELPQTHELVKMINRQLGGIEEIIDLNAKYAGIPIVKVVECAPLEGSDHLNVTKIDDGGVIEGVERDENGLVQVVCGAPNVRAGMLAVWLAPGMTVPETFDDTEPFVLSAKPLRGVVSNGMLASPMELAFGDAHEGIMEIVADEWKPNDIEIVPGASFAEAYGLNDTIIDIENKMFTHRPDCFGQLGVAREIAGIMHQPFVSPDWYLNTEMSNGTNDLPLTLHNDVPDKVRRFMAVTIKDVTIKQSPIWLQAELVRLGSKPINNIVDVTNYVMLLTAQPMHAYDYDKVASGTLGARLANQDEQLILLGGKTIELDQADLVITDGNKPIGLAGIMGGQDTEVSSQTRNIILECANFDMYTIRRASMRHGIFTDASTRFTKGQSPLQNASVLNIALMSVFDTAGGEQASTVIDDNHTATFDGLWLLGSRQIAPDFINERLGSRLTNEEIEKILGNVEFAINKSDNQDVIDYTPPFWRTDIEIPEDVVEEVGRLYGFDNLPQSLPLNPIAPAAIDRRIGLKKHLRDILSRAGANEVLTYSFVHKNMLEKAGQDVADAYQLSNALSPELHYYRRTLLPSLLDKIYSNARSGYSNFALFEIGKGHKKSAGMDDDGVPVEQQYLALVNTGGDFYGSKRILEFTAEKLGIELEYIPVENGKLFEPKRSALIKANGEIIGAIGEYRAAIKRNFKLPDPASGFEIDFDKLLAATEHPVASYRPLSRFPSIERDITIKVSADIPFVRLSKVLSSSLSKIGFDYSMEPGAIYQPESSDSKHISFHISISSSERTLTSDDATETMRIIGEDLLSELHATVI